MLVILSLSLTFSIGFADWSGSYCNTSGSCSLSSNTFTQPYCIQGENGNKCVWLGLTNKLSSFDVGESKTLGSLSMKEFIQNYCSFLLGDMSLGRIYYSKPNKIGDWDWQQTFDSHQSMFVNALCSSFKDENESMPFFTGDYLKEVFKDKDIVDLLKLKQRSGGKDNCSLKDDPSLNKCDISIYATKIYSAIMSDIFKIKYAQVLNVDKYEDFDADKSVESFLSGYFYYADAKSDKDFKQTVSVLKSNQKYYRKVLNSVKVINNSALASPICPIDKEVVGVNFIACALHSSQGNGSALTPSFVTMVYNEILNYRIFELYMEYWTKAQLQNNISEDAKMKYEWRLLDFQKYAALQTRASLEALHTFEDFNMTYPLHIGLLLYQERMKSFRDKKLSPIVTIFYSLSEKLQNVQLPS